MLLFSIRFLVVKPINIKSYSDHCQGAEEIGNRELLFHKYVVSFIQGENYLHIYYVQNV